MILQSGFIYLENGPGGNHHQKSYYSSHRGEVAHEDRVAVGVWESSLQLGLPRDFDDINGHAVSDNHHCEIFDIRTLR